MNKSYNPCDDCQYNHSKQNQESGMCKYCEFKKYIDLEEQELILRLPCKVGDAVYSIEEKSKKQGRKKVAIQFIEQREVDSISVGFSGVPVVTVCNNENGWEIFYDNDFGKTVFLTKEEAEAKLKELEGSEEE